MKKITIFIVLTCAFVSAYGQKIQYQMSNPLPDSLRRVLKSTLQDFQKKYGSLGTIVVRDTTEQNIYANDGTTCTLARAHHGSVSINVFALKRYNLTKIDFRNTIAHEAKHMLIPEGIRLTKPFKLADGHTIIGFRGLNLIVDSVNDVKFAKIEEGSAEALASLLYSDYTCFDSMDVPLGTLVRCCIQAKWITTTDLIRTTKESDVPGLVGLILGIPTNKVTASDIVCVVNAFNYAYQKSDYKLPFLALQQKRGGVQKFKF